MYWSISEMILDLVQNSIDAGAQHIVVTIRDEATGCLAVSIEDNGCGMDDEGLRRAIDPFWSDPHKHPGRRVGLGLPFLGQTADQTGGTWDIRSTRGVGTTLSFTLDCTHPDLPPRGDFSALFVDLFCFQGGYEMEIRREAPGGGYSAGRRELQDILGDLAVLENRQLARDFFDANESEIFEG